MRVLITGVAGFIGSNLALRLQAAGWDVSGVDAFTDYYAVPLKTKTAKRLRAGGIEVLETDLAHASLSATQGVFLQKVDAVVHLAAQPGISAKTPWEDYNRNNGWRRIGCWRRLGVRASSGL